MQSTREQIIETTCELLEKQGYHGTGLNEIIRESGSPKGSLYHYFPGGKEELAAEAIRHVGQRVLQRIQTNLAEVEDPAEAIRMFIMTIAQHVEKSGFQAGGPITTIALETSSTSDRLPAECHSIYGTWQAAFADKLTSSRVTAERAGRLAALIISAIEGGVILCRTSRTREPLENVAEEIGILLQETL